MRRRTLFCGVVVVAVLALGAWLLGADVACRLGGGSVVGWCTIATDDGMRARLVATDGRPYEFRRFARPVGQQLRSLANGLGTGADSPVLCRFDYAGVGRTVVHDYKLFFDRGQPPPSQSLPYAPGPARARPGD